MFDVGRSMFDVGLSSFKPTPYDIDTTCEHLKNSLALMGLRPYRNVGTLALQAAGLDFIFYGLNFRLSRFSIKNNRGGGMKDIAQNKERIGIAAIVSVLLLVVIQLTLIGCATVPERTSGIRSSQAATDIWHSYQILPNYKYYYTGSDSQPNYIIGIDDRYQLTSKLWKPVDLTPEMLKNWINYIRPRVGYSPELYGADILDLNGNRVGLWYSVRDWRLLGTASVNEKNQVSVTRPAVSTGRMKRSDSYK